MFFCIIYYAIESNFLKYLKKKGIANVFSKRKKN